MSPPLRRGLYLLLGAATLLPWVSAPVALLAGLAFSLALGNPFPGPAKQAQTWLLQASVVGLGAGMQLGVVARVGASGVVQTLVGLTATLTLALALSRVLATERTTSLLIGVGTAICGGSAIAAVAPAIGAKSHQASVALAVVFLLNAAALLVFPRLGHLAGLDPARFGLWAALAVHDTSSVVGAALAFDPAALGVATTVKLARALWILPLTVLLARFWPREGGGGAGAAKRPWFIAGFLAMAALVSWVPALAEAGAVVAALARRALVTTLYLVGSGVSREALKEVGARPLVLGVLLWVAVSAATLGAILGGWLQVPGT